MLIGMSVIATITTFMNLSLFSRMSAGAVAPLLEGELYPEGLDEGREWELRTYLHLVI